MKSHASKKSRPRTQATARISREPLNDLRGSNPLTGQPKRPQPFVNHGLEESPDEARARFHSELLDRVRTESATERPMPESARADLLETIDVWEQSLWSTVDGKPVNE